MRLRMHNIPWHPIDYITCEDFFIRFQPKLGMERRCGAWKGNDTHGDACCHREENDSHHRRSFQVLSCHDNTSSRMELRIES